MAYDSIEFLTTITGMMVYPGLLFIMRGEDYWDKPDLFMPERFLDKDLKIKHSEKSGWFH